MRDPHEPRYVSVKGYRHIASRPSFIRVSGIIAYEFNLLIAARALTHVKTMLWAI
jgi:hypothetical protein